MASNFPRAMPAAIRGARLFLLLDLQDANGEPRVCLLIPGHRLPLAFPTVTAALAALRVMEAAHGR
jgi:hypothetical protein